MDRRRFLTSSGLALALAPTLAASTRQEKGLRFTHGAEARKGRLKHSICRWCYGGMDLEELCRNAVAMGISSIEILDEPDWAIVKKHGLTCAVANGPGGIPRGWNRQEHHDELVQRSEDLIPKIAAARLPNMIVFSGNKDGQSPEEGIDNCTLGLKRIAGIAEKHKVTVVFEILNSKVDHGDYAFDHMRYGVDVVKRVGSERVKILYDIYHAQIMEGDVIRTIRDHKDLIGHYHTGGVPGRNEIDDGQELNYRAICRAIADTGFQGFVSQEFVPTRDAMTSLRQAIEICDV